MKSFYRLILFDADGTLFDYEQAEDRALESAFRAQKVPYQPSLHRNTYRAINQELWESFERGEIRAEKLRVERFRRFSEATGLSLDPVSTSASYLHFLAQGAFLYPGAERVVQTLKENYKVGIITNGLKEVQRSRIAKTTLVSHVCCVVVSDEVGVQKPDPAIFRIALQEAGESEPQRALVVGDSLTSDIQGGINAGMDTCWFNPQAKENKSGLRPTYEIRKLAELLDLLL